MDFSRQFHSNLGSSFWLNGI